MERFLYLNYYFSRLPDPNFQFTKLTLAMGLLLVAGGFALGIYRKKYLKDTVAKKILKKYPGRLELYGLLVIFLLGVRELGIPYLSMRVWWLVLALFFLYTFGGLALNYKKEYGKREERVKKNVGTLKYLPKKKH